MIERPEHSEEHDGSARGRRPSQLPAAVRARTLLLGFVLAGAVYLLLIDTSSLPELYAGAAVALLAALALTAARTQDGAEVSFSPRWLARTPRLLVLVVRDIAIVAAAAVSQAVGRRHSRGSFRATAFHHGGGSRDAGRRALTEALGSLAPNTIVVGVDPERDALLVHQLSARGAASELDVLGLG